MKREQEILLEVIRSALGDKKSPDSLMELSVEECRKVMDYARKQDMFPFLQYFDSFTKGECRDYFFKTILSRISADMEQERELRILLDVFEQNGIDCIPLKGSVTRRMYPAAELRTMGDLDILYRREQTGTLRKVMEQLGYEYKGEAAKHDKYKKPGVIVEMHKELLKSESVGYEYLENIWERAQREEGRKHIWRMSLEDHYIFTLCHLLEHFIDGGIGIRMVLDIYVLSQQPGWKKEDITKKLKDMGVDEFEKKIRTLSEIWFGERRETDREWAETYRDLAEYIVEGGIYGNEDNKRQNHTWRYRSRSRYLLKQLFPSYKLMKSTFPWLNTPLLLPAAWLYRFGRVWKMRRENVSIQFKTTFQMEGQNEENVLQRGAFFAKCGLGQDVCGKR